MALLFLAVELALYAGCFVCGILTAASVTITQGNLGGKCMLYGTVSYNATAHAVQGGLASPVSLCYFVSAISVLVAVTCFSLSLYWLYTCCIGGEVGPRGRASMTLTLGLCGVFLFFLLVSGCILKIGRDSLCRSIMSAVVNVTSCEQAQYLTWVAPFDGHQFYSGLHKAETAVWVNFFFWAIIGGLVLLQRGGGGGGGAGGSVSKRKRKRKPLFSRVTTTGCVRPQPYEVCGEPSYQQRQKL